VMTQVDHDLTPVNESDRQLRLIKNLGRHIRLRPRLVATVCFAAVPLRPSSNTPLVVLMCLPPPRMRLGGLSSISGTSESSTFGRLVWTSSAPTPLLLPSLRAVLHWVQAPSSPPRPPLASLSSSNASLFVLFQFGLWTLLQFWSSSRTSL
jgi:hypothetical protein